MKLRVFLLMLVLGGVLLFSPTPVRADSCVDLGPLIPPCACGGNCFLSDFIVLAIQISKYLLSLLFAAGVFMVFEAGFSFMTAAGSSEKIEGAKTWFRNAIFGVIIVLVAWLLVGTIVFFLAGNTKLFASGMLVQNKSGEIVPIKANPLNWWQIEGTSQCTPLESRGYACMDPREDMYDSSTNRDGWREEEIQRYCFSNGKCTEQPDNKWFRCCTDTERKASFQDDPTRK
ncbi:MAG: hypothetical protein HYV34_01565 [Candidatus Kerfeldbacteria bacterium]|nr:hypothetical protein [Candidatus Kerfeldbacteria bacterium]